MNALTAASGIRWLIDNWWWTLIRGVAAIIFGVLTFIAPFAAITTLTILWGAFALVDGALAIATAYGATSAETSSRWWMALVGVLGILAGIVTFAFPIGTSFGLLLFLAGWLIAGGVLQIVGAIRLRETIDNEWTLGLVGLLYILLGVSFVVYPISGLISVAWMIGAFAIVAGISYVMLSMRLKKLKDHG